MNVNKMLLKYKNVSIYSKPEKVFENAKMLFDENNIEYQISVSTRKNKKYMVRGEFTDNKWVHFGEMGYEDFTKHNDEGRRLAFLSRNVRWIGKPINTPAFLSYTLLW